MHVYPLRSASGRLSFRRACGAKVRFAGSTALAAPVRVPEVIWGEEREKKSEAEPSDLHANDVSVTLHLASFNLIA